MSEKKKTVVLEKAMTWAGVNFAPGVNEMPEAAAASAVKRKLGTLAAEAAAENGNAAQGASGENSANTGLPEDFPMKHVFEKLGADFDSVEKIQAMSLEDLVAADGIGEASAKKALAYGK